ncbi:unnamed protein product [Linum trigynum]|uniref:Uncharacterized protein n=1 Tax=Linum trigynum TaxID=586398 RepID=A0AAV2GAS4_9ROSI
MSTGKNRKENKTARTKGMAGKEIQGVCKDEQARQQVGDQTPKVGRPKAYQQGSQAGEKQARSLGAKAVYSSQGKEVDSSIMD